MSIKSEDRMLSGSIAVVGGGVLGMYLALKLRRRGATVTLYESAPQVGGLAAHDTFGGYKWDRFYHVILLSDLHTRALLTDLGLEGALRWGITRTGFYTDNVLYSLSDSVEFLRFPPLNLLDKLRLGGTIFLASRIRNWRRLEAQTCVAWLRRWSGKRVLEKIWLPLLKSKLGDNYEIASAAFIWAIIARMYAARRSGLKQEKFGYIDGGYQRMLEALAQQLYDSGVQICVGAGVQQLIDDELGVTVKLKNGECRQFDQAVATVPTGTIATICPQLTDIEKQRLIGVTYQGIVCASMLLRKPLSSFYVTNITDRWVPFTGVIEMTTLVDRSYFGGQSLVYLPIYLTQESTYWSKTDSEVQEDCLTALEKMYPDFRRTDVTAFNVSRARQVLAVSTLHYSERQLPAVNTSLRNVFILNSAQIAAGTLNVNETLAIVNDNLSDLCGRLCEKTRTI